MKKSDSEKDSNMIYIQVKDGRLEYKKVLTCKYHLIFVSLTLYCIFQIPTKYCGNLKNMINKGEIFGFCAFKKEKTTKT